MEQFREVFKRLFPKLRMTSPVPTTVLVFKSEKTFKPYKPVSGNGKRTEWIAGYFQGGEDINYVVLSIEGEKQQTYQTIFHEYVHLLVNNSFGKSRIPPWFNEGIAEYYDQFSIENDQKVNLGNLNESHLYSLQQTKLIPFETFFNIDYYSLHQQGNHSANIFYAQSWAFMHYLIHGNEGKRRGQIDVFLNAVLKGMKPREAFQNAFQTDFATMEKELKNYVELSSYKGTVVTLSEKLTFENGMTSAPIAESEAKAHLGDLLLHANRLPEAEKHLTEAIATGAESAFANTSLGMLRMRQNNFAEARKHLEKAIATDSKNHLIYYNYAYLLSRESMGEGNMFSSFPDNATKKMRDALKKAIALNPAFPESYSLLSFISLVRNDEIDEAIAAINQALQLAPGSQDYMLNLAGLYARKLDFIKAQTIADAVFKSATEGDLRARAQGILRNISMYREQQEMMKNPGGSQRIIMLSPGDKPPTPEELEKLRAQAERDSITEALRVPKTNETRILAHLSKIECGRDGIIYSIKKGAEIVKLHSTDFQDLDLMTFVPDMDGQIGCEGLKKEVFAVLTYVPGDISKAKTAGKLVAIEMVPATFVLK